MVWNTLPVFVPRDVGLQIFGAKPAFKDDRFPFEHGDIIQEYFKLWSLFCKQTSKEMWYAILGLQQRDMAATLMVNATKIILKNLLENGVYFPQDTTEMILFLTTNMASKKLRANQQ